MSRYTPFVASSLLIPLLAIWLHASETAIAVAPERPATAQYYAANGGETIRTFKPNLSVSPEDELMIRGADALERGDLKSARDYLSQLYTLNKKTEYLIELLKVNIQLKRYTESIMLADTYLADNPKEVEVRRYLLGSLAAKKEYARAKAEAVKISMQTKQPKDYETAGDLYQSTGDIEGALKYYKLSYTVKPEESVVDKIGSVLFDMGKGVEAASYYETHMRIYGCSKFLCQRLTNLYANLGDIEHVIEISRKLYERYKEVEIANSIIQLYLERNNLDGLIEFLKKSKFDDLILLEAYKAKHDFINASAIAMKLYQKSNNIEFLGQATIYRFEGNPKPTPAFLEETIKNLRTVIAASPTDLYLNYLGYLMIDFNINVTEGIEFVKKALAINPTNEAYLDSLAWGYYKLQRCKEAYEPMQKAYEAMKEDKTVKEHWEAIRRCYNRSLDPGKTLRGMIRK